MAAAVNELTQKLIDLKATLQNRKGALDAMLDQQTAAKAAYFALVEKQASGSLSDAERAQMPLAEAAHSGFDSRISAQRKLVAAAEREVLEAEQVLETERQRIAAEDAKLAKQPSGRVSVGAPNAEKDPKRGFADHREYLNAVMRAGMGYGVDERLRPLATQGSDEAQTASNPYGGFLVPAAIAPGILSVRPQADPLEPLLTHVPMTAPTVAFNARVDKNHSTSVSGGLVWTRRPETVDGTSARMAFEQVTLTANEEFGLAIASEKILTDSPTSFVAILTAGFADEQVAFAMNERINGTGVGERLGILNSPCLIQVAAEAQQAAGTIIVENIDKMAARQWRYNQSVYLANQNTRPQLRGLVRNVGTGGVTVPYFTQGDGVEYLDGRPIFFTEFCKALGTLGDIINLCPSEYLEGLYQSDQYAESIHARFAAAERMFRFYRRTDGQCWWRSALTPRNGDTLSCCVAIATR